MNSAELKNKISDLRPNYSDKYRSMIETISNKQEKWEKERVMFSSPTVFIDILKEINK